MTVKSLIVINAALFFISLLGILLVFLLYPMSLWIISFFIRKRGSELSKDNPMVSLIVVARNAEAIIDDKIQNFLSLNYPRDQCEIIVFSDGSTDQTERIIAAHKINRVKFLSTPLHRGKSNGLNDAVESCSGDIIVFSDADALLSPDALHKIVRHYANPEIGGICGQRVIYKDDVEMKSAQKDYIKFDSAIKILESRIGSITSNDGKLYSIRRKLFQPIEPAVTDDLYCCLSIIKQKYRFIFEPEARAFIRIPSRSPSHEILRRRRIVARSLRGIYLMRQILNPFKHGAYSIRLLINKILRRMLPVFLILLFLGSAVLAFSSTWVMWFWIFQSAGYFLALLYPMLNALPQNMIINKIRRLSTLACYFCLGNLGTLLGLMDFLLGKRIEKWEPIKTHDRM